MKKRVIGISLLLPALLISCSSKKDDTKKDDRAYYVDAYGKIVDKLTEYESKTELKSLTFPDDYDEFTEYGNVTGTKAMIYFYELLYKNKNYPIVDNPVKIIADYKKNNVLVQHNDNYFKNVMDKENNKINVEIYGTTATDDYSLLAYTNVSINYDFDNGKLIGFELFVFDVNNDNSLECKIAQKYENDKMYELKYAKEAEACNIYNDIYLSYYGSLDTAVLAGDFSAEYIKSIDDTFGEEFFTGNSQVK